MLTAILSAPDLNIEKASFKDLIPPPTVIGIKTFLDSFDMMPPTLFLPYRLATVSKNKSSSAELL